MRNSEEDVFNRFYRKGVVMKHSKKLAALAVMISAGVAAPAALAQDAKPADADKKSEKKASPCAPKKKKASPCGPAKPAADKSADKQKDEKKEEKK